MKEHTQVTPQLLDSANSAWCYYVETRFEHLEGSKKWNEFCVKTKPDPIQNPKFHLYFKTAQNAITMIHKAGKDVSLEEFFIATKDVFSLWLDSVKGQLVTDPKIFRDFAAYWENEFFQDMTLINVRPPDVLTRYC